MGILLYITVLVKWTLVSIQDCVSPAGPAILAEAAQSKAVSREWSTAVSPDQSCNTGAVTPGLPLLSSFTDVPFSSHAESQLTFFALNSVPLHCTPNWGLQVALNWWWQPLIHSPFNFLRFIAGETAPVATSGISSPFLFALNLGIFYEQLKAAKANTIRPAF